VPICTSGDDPSPVTTTTTVTPDGGGSCGGTLTASSGTIESEGFPSEYKNEQDCTWIISGRKPVKFTVVEMDLEPDSQCNYDYLAFLEADMETLLDKKICGGTIPEPLYTSGNGGAILFHSDHSVTGKGFKIKYEMEEETPSSSCQGVKLETGQAVQPVYIESPNYPSNYPNDKECDWTVSVPAGQRVKLVFQKFDTEASYDLVKVYDGGNDGSTLIKDLSGNSVASITSTGNQLYVTFKSDYSTVGKGFKAVVSGER